MKIEEIEIECIECGSLYRIKDVLLEDVLYCCVCGNQSIETSIIEVESLENKLFISDEDE